MASASREGRRIDQLRQIAGLAGKDAGQVAQEVLAHALDRRARKLERARQAIESLDRGEFIDHDEVEKVIERDFRF